MADDAVWPEALFADVSRADPAPLHFQISTRLEHAIRSGLIPAGARLESEITIGHRLGLSRETVRRATRELVGKGLLIHRRGVGTQVAPGQVTRRVEPTSLSEDLSTADHEPGTHILEHDTRPAPENAAVGLGVAEGTEVVFLRRRRSVDGIAVAILESYLPPEFSDITTEQLETRRLYQIFRTRGVTVRIANQKIGARRAAGDEGALLDVDGNGPVLTVERVTFDGSGRPIEYGRHCYRPDRYCFETCLVAK